MACLFAVIFLLAIAIIAVDATIPKGEKTFGGKATAMLLTSLGLTAVSITECVAVTPIL